MTSTNGVAVGELRHLVLDEWSWRCIGRCVPERQPSDRTPIGRTATKRPPTDTVSREQIASVELVNPGLPATVTGPLADCDRGSVPFGGGAFGVARVDHTAPSMFVPS
ncbi:MAG: hypothetical protein KDB23_10215 [Planctomycetales bacterium]|nr:hypothetical protein [Planctomycetales bacterium]